MESVPKYQGIVCYEISSFFRTRPRLGCCPECSGPLEVAAENTSVTGREFLKDGYIPAVKTHLFRCDQCGWWALREEYTDYETAYWDWDYIVFVNPQVASQESKITENLTSNSEHVHWKVVLQEKEYWEKPLPMSRETALWLFGEEEILRTQQEAQHLNAKRSQGFYEYAAGYISEMGKAVKSKILAVFEFLKK